MDNISFMFSKRFKEQSAYDNGDMLAAVYPVKSTKKYLLLGI